MPKPKYNPDFPTVRILIFILCNALIALTVGVGGILIVCKALTTGKIWSVGVVFHDTRIIYRSISPTAYWTMIGFMSFSCVLGFVLGTFSPIVVIRAYRKKLHARRGRNSGFKD